MLGVRLRVGRNTQETLLDIWLTTNDVISTALTLSRAQSTSYISWLLMGLPLQS